MSVILTLFVFIIRMQKNISAVATIHLKEMEFYANQWTVPPIASAKNLRNAYTHILSRRTFVLAGKEQFATQKEIAKRKQRPGVEAESVWSMLVVAMILSTKCTTANVIQNT